MFRFKKLYSVVLLPASVRLSVCPHNYSSQIWARIAKFAPNMHPRILSDGVEFRGQWPWPSWSFWPFWLTILGHSACPRNYSSQVWVQITKISPKMHHAVLLAGIENGDHWPWPPRTSRPFWLWILGNLACVRNNLILAGLTKFPPNMHLEILLTGIETGSHWPGP